MPPLPSRDAEGAGYRAPELHGRKGRAVTAFSAGLFAPSTGPAPSLSRPYLRAHRAPPSPAPGGCLSDTNPRCACPTPILPPAAAQPRRSRPPAAGVTIPAHTGGPDHASSTLFPWVPPARTVIPVIHILIQPHQPPPYTWTPGAQSPTLPPAQPRLRRFAVVCVRPWPP